MTDLKKKVYLVRHGETEWALNGRHTGLTDIPLTERGREEARLAGKQLAGKQFGLVLTSPLSRAADTCRLAGLEGKPCDDLVEWKYGDYEGLTTPEIRKEVADWTIFKYGAPGGETVEQVDARAERVIEQVLAAEGDIALFSHGHMSRVLAACWIEIGAAGGRHLVFETAALGVLGWAREDRALLRWNDTSHLV